MHAYVITCLTRRRCHKIDYRCQANLHVDLVGRVATLEQTVAAEVGRVSAQLGAVRAELQRTQAGLDELLHRTTFAGGGGGSSSSSRSNA
jgi:hypothetical protein